ncbi:suppressor of fused domain protein [Leptospira mayottensis]|uniref:suppressor of fused domain protein n=1 Tax=Leptospira mayottensis TaxID=1137606 RepID=UPI0002BF3908|nr:suppressor of fused domain protein [Leptospira mayottensis]AXR59838.1 suppressor of fused domain protein [Leptospira mayottensis]AZQ00841.1 suppressor of fused protein [Leptospira mayottensis 200901116]TGN09036.1 suppressor of fused domain protein [Leptospira mayottensis]
MTHFTEPKVIYQEANPYGTFTAYLEDDGRTVYLYLQGEQNPEFGIKSVWVCNRVEAPDKRSVEDLSNGLAPLLLYSEVNEPKPHPALEEKELYFIWTEEGDGVALFYKETLIAFLPSWSGTKGFHGYSFHAKIEALTAYPLGNTDFGIIPDRVRASRDFWEARSKQGTWKEIQEKRLSFLESKFGKHNKYWSADGGKYPQLGIARFQSEKFPEILIYSTIGMSAQNMPTVELFHKDYEDYARIELILAVKIGSEGLERSESWVPHLIGELIRFPWNMAKWFGHGHTITMSRKDPEALYMNFTSILFRDFKSFTSLLNAPDLSGFVSENGKQVRFLTLLPVSEEEKEYAQKDGIQSFNRMWDEKGFSWYHNAERQAFI